MNHYFKDVCSERQASCIPFTWSTNDKFEKSLDGFTKEKLDPVIVFTSSPTTRFIGDADEKLLIELVRSHPELTCVAFQNVTISERSFLVGAGLWQLLNSVILIDAKVRIMATFKHGREFIWEINVDDGEIQTDGSDVGLVYSLRRVVRGLIRQHFLDHEELYMKWLGVVLPLLDKEYINERKVVLHFLHEICGH